MNIIVAFNYITFFFVIFLGSAVQKIVKSFTNSGNFGGTAGVLSIAIFFFFRRMPVFFTFSLSHFPPFPLSLVPSFPLSFLVMCMFSTILEFVLYRHKKKKKFFWKEGRKRFSYLKTFFFFLPFYFKIWDPPRPPCYYYYELLYFMKGLSFGEKKKKPKNLNSKCYYLFTRVCI